MFLFSANIYDVRTMIFMITNPYYFVNRGYTCFFYRGKPYERCFIVQQWPNSSRRVSEIGSKARSAILRALNVYEGDSVRICGLIELIFKSEKKIIKGLESLFLSNNSRSKLLLCKPDLFSLEVHSYL